MAKRPRRVGGQGSGFLSPEEERQQELERQRREVAYIERKAALDECSPFVQSLVERSDQWVEQSPADKEIWRIEVKSFVEHALSYPQDKDIQKNLADLRKFAGKGTALAKSIASIEREVFDEQRERAGKAVEGPDIREDEGMRRRQALEMPDAQQDLESVMDKMRGTERVWENLEVGHKKKLQNDIKEIAYWAARGNTGAQQYLEGLHKFAKINGRGKDTEFIRDIKFAEKNAKEQVVREADAPDLGGARRAHVHDAPSDFVQGIIDAQSNWEGLPQDGKERLQSDIRRISHFAVAGDKRAQKDLDDLKKAAGKGTAFAKYIDFAEKNAREKAGYKGMAAEGDEDLDAPSSLVKWIVRAESHWDSITSDDQEHAKTEMRGVAHRALSGDKEAQKDLADLRKAAGKGTAFAKYIDFAEKNAREKAGKAEEVVKPEDLHPHVRHDIKSVREAPDYYPGP